jgi:hypothetical protein
MLQKLCIIKQQKKAMSHIKLWNNKEYKLSSNVVITPQNLSKHINLFNTEVLSLIKDDQHILFIPRLHLIDNQYISISNLIKLTRIQLLMVIY